MYFGSLSSINPLECISMKNQECKDLKLLILIVMIAYFILLVLRQINVVVTVIMLMIHLQEFVLLIL